MRWDPGGLARREIDERSSAHLPPASRVATVTGEPDDLAQAHLDRSTDIAATIAAEAERLGRRPSVCVLPEGPQTIPYVHAGRAQGKVNA